MPFQRQSPKCRTRMVTAAVVTRVVSDRKVRRAGTRCRLEMFVTREWLVVIDRAAGLLLRAPAFLLSVSAEF